MSGFDAVAWMQVNPLRKQEFVQLSPCNPQNQLAMGGGAIGGAVGGAPGGGAAGGGTPGGGAGGKSGGGCDGGGVDASHTSW